MKKATVKDINLKDKRVFMRADYNVPLKGGVIRDDTRIRESLPTIQYLLSQNAKIILASHLGRPEGKVVEEMRLKPVADRLSELLKRPVTMLNDCIGDEVSQAVKNMKSGDIVLLENLRFYKHETKNDREFSEKLASLAEVYVDDAFGTAHRAHASTYGVAEFLPAVSGLLLEKELTFLGKLIDNPEKPFVALLGGSKVSDKVEVIKNLMNLADSILIGGGMAFTFLKVQGREIGKSLLDEKEDLVREILEMAEAKKVALVLPSDVVVTEEIKEGAPHKVVSVNEIPVNMMGVDIGPKTVEEFRKYIAGAKTIFWNGPMGVFEVKDFATGTLEVARMLAETKALTCIGGGDSVAAVKQLGFGDQMSHLSTGGGASLEFLEGKELPGVAILMDKEKINA
ncbi:MAG: phosphoglycerate kinase [Candidatus Xenobiia bacterium LiM19]